MTVHTLTYIHEKEDIVKEHFKKKLKKKLKKEVTKEPPGLLKQKPTKTITTITDDIVNTYIQENQDIAGNYLRHESVMKAQRKQMNARSPLNSAILTYLLHFILYI